MATEYVTFNNIKVYLWKDEVKLCPKCHSDELTYKKNITDEQKRKWYVCRKCQKLSNEDELKKMTAHKAYLLKKSLKQKAVRFFTNK